MQKIKITLEVPERIAVLVQSYVQRELLGTNSYNFAEYLRSHKVSGPIKYLPEISIGIEHPDDEPVKIDSDYLETHYVISAYIDKYQDLIQSLIDIQNNYGMGGLWEKAESLTNEFQSLYDGTAWGEELDWHDTLETFLNEKLK